ncbi:hypothetical protein TSMEX_007176, partial [Taenia solium]
SYLKCLQYLQLRNPEELSQSQMSQLKLFIANCSKDEFKAEHHYSNLRKYVECFRLACFMPL